ncbi:unannotated protein [freshwater metagenome]|uniref:Unannotated protein n=1 Tax=freshwater metagenome TaxID=449393 RepID=A0A6J6S9T8_9ZZZZ
MTSYSATLVWENQGSRRRRDQVCTGGSLVIGGSPSGNGSGAPSGARITPTSAELKCSTSWAIATTSSYLVGIHDPPQRSVCATGQVPRSSSYTGYGSFTNSGSTTS